jgi:hypothetical protein
VSSSNLSAVTKDASNQAIAGRTRVAGIYYTCDSAASSFTLHNGDDDQAEALLTIKTPDASGATDVILPDMGILFDKGVYVDFEDAQVLSVTLFFYGGASVPDPTPPPP